MIRKIRKRAGLSLNPAVLLGIGDDTAVLHPHARSHLLVTTDLCVENVHFTLKWHPAVSVGHRCLARGLSDIAAMGGVPIACFLSLAVPGRLPDSWVDGFLAGLRALTRQHKVQLAGGDISSAREIVADIVVLGEVPAGQAVLRSGARPGDRIFVTGELGESAAALKRLRAGKRVAPEKTSRHFYPEARLDAGRALRRRGLATAMIDLSDGLSIDLAHICRESGVACLLDGPKIPIAPGASLDLALHGGEDYELLFTSPRSAKVPRRIAGVSITEIGEITPRSNYSAAIRILGDNGKAKPLAQRGWEHFKK